MQKELEERFISSVKCTEDFSSALVKGISRDSFIIYREPFEFLAKHISRYDSVPSSSILESNFPDFKYVNGVQEEEQIYLIDELIKSEVRRRAISVLDKGADLLHSDVYGGLDYIMSNLTKVRKQANYSISFTDSSSLDRLEKIKERKNKLSSGSLIGIKTGLSFFDDQLLGWQQGNLVSIIARFGKGKSFLSLYLACFAYSEGNRVLYITPEMTVSEVEDRWDTVMGALLGYKFSNKGLMVGDVNVKEYEKYLREVNKRKDWIMVDSDNDKPFTINAIAGLIDQYAPDVVVIDGFLLLDIGDKTWDNMCNAASDLKAIAQSRKIVCLVTSQATRSAKGAKILDETMVYGGDALGQASNVLILMSDDPDEEKVRWVSIAKKRAGEGFNKPVKISFDVDIGNIGI